MEFVFRTRIGIEPPAVRGAPQRITLIHDSADGMGMRGMRQPDEPSPGAAKRKPVKVGKKVGRNDPCPCGSGKKFKKCCGVNQ